MDLVDRDRDRVDDAELARRATGGDGQAFAELFDRWFDRAHDVAWHIVRNRDTAADVAQETFVTAWQGIGGLRRPESFGGWILRIARNKALHRLAADQRARPVGDGSALVDHDRARRLADDPAEPVAAAERDDLVWAAAAALGHDDASILSLHLRHGLTAGDLAAELDVAPNAVHQRLFRLRKRLAGAIGAWALWQLGRPRCDDLRHLLAAAGARRFDHDTAAMITAHARGCPACDTRRTLRLSPEALFAATPLVAAAPLAKAEAATTLTGLTSTPADPTADPSGAVEPPGGGSGGGGDPGDAAGPPGPGGSAEPAAAPVRGDGAGRWRLVGAGAGVVAVVAVVAALLSSGDGTTAPEDEVSAGTAPSPTVTTALTTTVVPATSVVVAPASTTGPPPSPATTRPVDPGPPPEPPPPPDPEPEPEPEPAAPVIGGFRASRLPTGNCGAPGEVVTTFTWDTTGATSARLGPAGGAATEVEPTGTHTACTPPGTGWTLTATNDAGATTASATAP